MCLLTVPRNEPRSPPCPRLPAGEGPSDEPTPLEGYPSTGPNRAARRRRERGQVQGWIERWTSPAALGPARPGRILDRPLLNLPRVERRVTPRVLNQELSRAERDACRSLIASASGCGTRWGAFRRVESTDRGERELRLVCQLKCGTRMCHECDEVIRRRESVRAEGPWSMFLTLTVPPEYGTALQAWRKIHTSLALLLKRMRRASAESDTWPLLSTNGFGHFKRYQSDDNADSMERSSDLEYAWVLEPHQSGKPHVHMVINCEYVDYSWLIEQWRSCTRTASARVFGDRVWQRDGICRYLAKYISKTHLPPDVLGVMRRRRLWASTIKRTEAEPGRWTREEGTTADEAWMDAEVPALFEHGQGWEIEMAKPGGYAIWSRPAGSLPVDPMANEKEYRTYFDDSTNVKVWTSAEMDRHLSGWRRRSYQLLWHGPCWAPCLAPVDETPASLYAVACDSFKTLSSVNGRRGADHGRFGPSVSDGGRPDDAPERLHSGAGY